MIFEKTWVDKSEWGEGPWMTEPDKVQWKDEETGLGCRAIRNNQGVICGYVGVPESHPAFGKKYSYIYHEDIDKVENSIRKIDIHGGLTFSGLWEEDDNKDKVWWFGFDTDHYNDYAPQRESIFLIKYPYTIGQNHNPSNYKTLDYVKNECKRLAKKLKALEHE